MKIDYSSLNLAITSLEKAINRSQGAKDDEELRDAVIQRFEYTYELCWKMLKRRLESDHPNPAEIDGMSFPVLMREGAQRGLIDNVESWMEYREQRNITAHTYDKKKAQSVYQSALMFIDDARQLYKGLVEVKDA